MNKIYCLRISESYFLKGYRIFYSLRWLIYVLNPVVNSKLPAILSHRLGTLLTNPLLATQKKKEEAWWASEYPRVCMLYSEYVVDLFSCVLRIWRSRHNTLDAINIQWHVFWSCSNKRPYWLVKNTSRWGRAFYYPVALLVLFYPTFATSTFLLNESAFCCACASRILFGDTFSALLSGLNWVFNWAIDTFL